MKRDGKKLKTLAPGDRRRLSDARNAWRKMTDDQREQFLFWIHDGGGEGAGSGITYGIARAVSYIESLGR
jgi:hypothetical protein